MPKVFISYVKDNADEVSMLASRLREFDIAVWLDKDDIKPGQRWKSAIRQAIMDGDFFLACFSKEYNDRLKTYMNEELTLAIDELRMRPSDRAWFIPILLSSCEVPNREIGAGETLQSIQWVELYKDWELGIKKIIDVIYPNKYREYFPKGYKLVLDKIPHVSGRIALEAIFETIATKELKKEIFIVTGKGGMGKSTLLKQLIDRLNSAHFLPIKYVFVDFYHTENQTPQGLMKSIFEALNFPSNFIKFSETQKELEKLQHSFSSANTESIQKLYLASERNFFNGLEKISHHYKLIFIFDTTEILDRNIPAIMDNPIFTWFEKLFSNANNLNVIFSSRSTDFFTDIREKVQKLGFNISEYELASFATFDVVQMIEQAIKDPNIKDKLSDPNAIENLLTLSSGNPLILSLAIEMLKRYDLNFSELDKNSLPDELIKRLIHQ